MRKTVFILILISLILLSNLDAEKEKENIIQLAIKLNGILSKYIDIHNYIFDYSPNRVTFDLSRFERIDFHSSYKKMVTIHSDIISCNKEISKLTKFFKKKERFVIQLDKYSKSLTKTIVIFEQILLNLNLKAKDSLKYNYEEYDRQLNLYKKSIEEYRELGKNLNKLYEEFIK